MTVFETVLCSFGQCSMTRARWHRESFLVCAILCVLGSPLFASEHHGQVTFNGLPVPGVTVTVSQGDKSFVAITDQQGVYSFPDLTDGAWKVAVAMSGFASVNQDIEVGPNSTDPKWELKLLSLDQMKAELQKPEAPAVAAAPPANQPTRQPSNDAPPAQTSTQTSSDELSQSAADGLLINGSVNIGASSPFAQFAAFGNNRTGSRGLYNGGIGVIVDNSATDARPYSLTGQNTPKPSYSRVTGLLALGGPLRIPHLFKRGPNFFVNYQWARNTNNTIQSALMPDAVERSGVFPSTIINPLTGTPFAGNTIPQNLISSQAQALLNFYPLPNSPGTTRYNYQIPILSHTHQDALQSRFDKTLNPKNQVYGRFAFQSTRSDAPNVFDFLDTTDLFGINTAVNWSHRFQQRSFLNLGYQFSRLSNRVMPFFENRENVSGNAGITGNNQEPMNWGPPTLNFSSGVASLSDSQSSFNRNEANGVLFSMLLSRGEHNVTFGGDLRRQEFNHLSQQDPRGTFTFTGALTGSDFADFLLGIPDTSSIAYGNADKYFRESVYDAYLTDDWRINPELTANLGVRWEYGAPITERFNRLVNLDVVPGFAAVAPVLASNPTGTLTGQEYPDSLVHPDKGGFEPRLGVAWRPIPTSSMVIHAGYGIYRDTSVYQTIALQMAQQPPLSKTFGVQNSKADPLTLANGFNATPSTANTFAIDPNFRVGYAQNWLLSVQRDLPGALQMKATYLGIKGTRGEQEFLPNTFPIGAANACLACPSGFAYLTSNGNSTRESGQLQLRRRLHSGFTALLQYTYSKSIDDTAALGGQGASLPSQITAQNSPPSSALFSSGTASPNLAVAQNWLDLNAERGLSTFDQRHLLSLQMQYTSGMGLKGGTLLSGWKGALLKGWTVATQINLGSGLPQTPVYFATVPGTGVTGTIRPDYTGAPIYAAPTGLFLNPAAFVAPAPGQWGNARRDSIIGPSQFSLNASLGRTFRMNDRLNLDLRVDSTNALNHVNYTAWNTVVNGAQFGLPASANPMRILQTSLRMRF